jgi:hypothetical protein
VHAHDADDQPSPHRRQSEDHHDKRADLILVRKNGANMRGLGDPYDALVQLATARDVDTTVVDGRLLFRAGQFTSLDYDKLEVDREQSLTALKTKAKWT